MKSRYDMKHIIKSLVGLILACTLLLGMAQTAYAAGISVSAGQNSVSVGKTVAFSITVPSGTEAWTYSVDYSSNLTLESGELSPMGFEGDSRTNQLVFRANSTGAATVRISAGSYCIAGVDYDASGSASVTIVAADIPDDSEPDDDPPVDTRSSNCSLASLTVSAGTLQPAFDPAVTEYTLSLPVNSQKLTVSAKTSDSRATVSGTGELTLQSGENKLGVVVTAENGATKTYTLTVKVAQAPTVFFSFGGEKLGVVMDTDGVQAPAGFTAGTVSYQSQVLPAWTNASHQTLLYLVNEKSVYGFYLYSAQGGVLSPYQPLAGSASSYIYTGVPDDKRSVAGLIFGTVTAFGQSYSGWTYEDPALKEYSVLYLMNSAGDSGYYTYDAQGETLQRFSGAIMTDDGGETLRVPMLYVYIAGGAAALLLLLMIVFAAVSGSRKKRIRLLEQCMDATADKDSSACPPLGAAAAEPPAMQPEVLSAEAEPSPDAESALEDTAAEPAPEPSDGSLTGKEKAEESSAASAEDAEPLESAEMPAEDAAPPEIEALSAADNASADSKEPAADSESASNDASLEDTLRHLPLDDLLKDIHNL